jgi:hypothetical protein
VAAVAMTKQSWTTTAAFADVNAEDVAAAHMNSPLAALLVYGPRVGGSVQPSTAAPAGPLVADSAVSWAPHAAKAKSAGGRRSKTPTHVESAAWAPTRTRAHDTELDLTVAL